MLEDIMEQKGINSTIKQENLSQLAGIMSSGNCMAELYILNYEAEEKTCESFDNYCKGIRD